MTIALDPGAFAFRSLRRDGPALAARRSRAVAASLRDNEARRRWVTIANVPHLYAEEHLVLPGDAALAASELSEAFPRDLLPGGALPESDPVARQVIAVLVDGLLPWSRYPHEVCCFAQPAYGAGGADGDMALDRRREFISRLVRLRGYEPLPINPATALVLAELGESGFTGIGLALGASGCDVAVVHRGIQIAWGRVERGGAWIDEQLAREIGAWRRDGRGEHVPDLEFARRRKERSSLESFPDDESRLVAELYRILTISLIEVVEETLDLDRRIPLLPQPLPVICGGGLARIPGFSELLQGALGRRRLAAPLAVPQVAGDQEYTIARGCLIRAELEEWTQRPPAARRSRETWPAPPAVHGMATSRGISGVIFSGFRSQNRRRLL